MVRCFQPIGPHLPQPGNALCRACQALARLAFTRITARGTASEILTDGRHVRACASQRGLLSRSTPTARPRTRALQKEWPQSFKVRRRTRIERAPSLTHTPHTNPVKHHELTVRLIPCAMQASGPTGWACVTGVWHAHTAAVARVWACGVRAEVACVRPPPRGAAGRWREEGARGRHVGCQGGCPAISGA